MNKHEHGEDDEVQTSESVRQTLVVVCQPPEAVQPSEAALNHPAARQQNKAFLRLGQSDTSVGQGLRLFIPPGDRVWREVPKTL